MIATIQNATTATCGAGRRFDSRTIAGLVHERLAAAQREGIEARARTVGVVRIMITDASRKALEK